MNFDPWNHPLKIQKSIETPTSKVRVHLGMWGFIFSHFPTPSRARNVTPGLHLWPAPSQAFALVVSLARVATLEVKKLKKMHWKMNNFNLNTYLINYGLYKSPKIPTHDLHCANNVTFNYKYDLMATKLFIVTKDFRKAIKTYRSNIQITPCGHQILAIAKKLEQIAKCIFTSIIKLCLMATTL
jgi:hypothetical protein